MQIGLNAHLLSSAQGYRSAGIHGFIYNTLQNLADYTPADWQITAMVNKDSPHQFLNVHLQHAPFNTESAIKRIVWEQAVQPFALRKFDLYHAMAFVSPLIQPRPAVVTVYDLSFIHYPQVLSSARRRYLETFTALSCRRAERIIAISHSTAKDVHELLNIPYHKIDTIHGGYDARNLYPVEQEQIGQFRKKKHLPERFWLFIGTLEPRKNLVTLLDAYAQLNPEERLPLYLGGGKGWDYEPIFERVERYNLQSDVHFLGFIPAEELVLWYNSAEAFIYPSVYEGFGLPVLEAMACGTPVIIADASSLPEVGGDCGQLVPPLDVGAWTETLRHVYHDEAWRISAREKGLTIAKTFTWQRTAQQTIQTYQKVLSGDRT
jgi:glycosyltransferase involved in cell wall biosynthesis